MGDRAKVTEILALQHEITISTHRNDLTKSY